jgi:hypothetical protein
MSGEAAVDGKIFLSLVSVRALSVRAVKSAVEAYTLISLEP